MGGLAALWKNGRREAPEPHSWSSKPDARKTRSPPRCVRQRRQMRQPCTGGRRELSAGATPSRRLTWSARTPHVFEETAHGRRDARSIEPVLRVQRLARSRLAELEDGVPADGDPGP